MSKTDTKTDTKIETFDSEIETETKAPKGLETEPEILGGIWQNLHC